MDRFIPKDGRGGIGQVGMAGELRNRLQVGSHGTLLQPCGQLEHVFLAAQFLGAEVIVRLRLHRRAAQLSHRIRQQIGVLFVVRPVVQQASLLAEAVGSNQLQFGRRPG